MGKEGAGSAILFAVYDGLSELWSILESQAWKGTMKRYKTGEVADQGCPTRHGEEV